MRVGEIWRFRSDNCLARITKIWQDEPEDHEKMISVTPVPYNEDDEFADYFLDEFLREFERVYDYKE